MHHIVFRLLWRDETCTYLAHCELETVFITFVTIIIIGILNENGRYLD